VKNIVICATQRCGSTMVIEDMRNTGVMGQPEEWFLPWTPTKTNIDWAETFQGVLRRATGPDGRSAIKIMANQLSPVNSCLSDFIKSSKPGIFPFVAEALTNWAWIKLTRKDVVAQAISRVMSSQTGINHATGHPEETHFAGNLQRGYDPDYNADTNYMYQAILEEVNAITLENLAWDRFFETNNVEHIVLQYEEIAADPNMNHLNAIAHFAGIPTPVQCQPRKLVKLANIRNTLWRDTFFKDAAARNFRAVK